jgi:phosphoribosyl 1,2-cyclic phosphodiesterase
MGEQEQRLLQTLLNDETITLAPGVHVDFAPGAGDVLWATLHAGGQTVEVGTLHGYGGFSAVMSTVAAWLTEHPAYADKVDNGRVLIGKWILNTRPPGEYPDHRCFEHAAAAKNYFRYT